MEVGQVIALIKSFTSNLKTEIQAKALTAGMKQAILDCFAHVAWVDDDGKDRYDALEAELFPPANLDHIGAVYTQTKTITTESTLDDLKSDLVVTAYYADTTSAVITNYNLSGTLATGTSTITVLYGGKTATFTVTVSEQSYVTSGLIHRYDAIENTSEGHDGSSGVWEDLVGDYDLTLTSASALTWGTDYLQFDGTANSSVKSASGEVENSESKTIEFVISTLSSSTESLGNVLYNSGMATDAYGKVILYSDNSVGVEGKGGATYPTGLNSISLVHYIAGEYGSDGKTSKVFVNGEQVTKGSTDHSLTGSQNKVIVGGSAGATEEIGYRFTGKIHAIRIYNRNLTAEEVAQNYAIDVTRFGLE